MTTPTPSLSGSRVPRSGGAPRLLAGALQVLLWLWLPFLTVAIVIRGMHRSLIHSLQSNPATVSLADIRASNRAIHVVAVTTGVLVLVTGVETVGCDFARSE